MKQWFDNPLLREISKPVLYLAVFALSGTLILALIHAATADRIAANERTALLQRIEQILADKDYDNDPLQDSIVLTHGDNHPLHSTTPVTIYRVRESGEPVTAVYALASPNGYNGSINLVIGVNADQTISGVRVVSHRETPGLGDKIDMAKSDWIKSFAGKSLQNPGAGQWAVRKDGGDFDQFTGATITPRAVVNTVKDVLRWSQKHQQDLFTQATTTPEAQTN